MSNGSFPPKALDVAKPPNAPGAAVNPLRSLDADARRRIERRIQSLVAQARSPERMRRSPAGSNSRNSRQGYR